ncbi:DUF3078 domain-containing protein [Saccharicrinis aurantiacus]|uniref:DUF3078 domain-containing protein n=1 Tax=Saccharicrinis aurantiacus TaxID=1849719 RepID=UPI00249369BD|nr:DUF3078 domain-containing protein [Saccharicrinis aurantiacus]
MKKTLISSILLFLLMSVSAQEEGDTIKAWTAGAVTSLNFSQVSLTNWAGGGNNSVAGTFLFKGFVNHKKDNIAWDNTLDFGYGLTKQGSENLAKSEDRIQLVSKFGYEAGKNWYYTVMADFKTQFAVGYKDPIKQDITISDFMAPGYLQLSLGMDYKPSENFTVFLSPITSKTTFVLNDSLSTEGAFGVDPGEKVREEYGASAKLLAKKADVIKNVGVYTRLDLFSSYTNNPQNIDVDWEFGISMKVNDYLSALFTCNLVYDDDIKYVSDEGIEQGARLQVKQLFGAGLTYSF